MKSVLISIQPKWAKLIAEGKKTVEVRKTRPKIDVPFKCYIYCTKAKDIYSIGGGLYDFKDNLYRLPTGEIKFGDGFELMGDWRGEYDENNFLNGKVIGEFVCDYITSFKGMGEVQAIYNEFHCTCLKGEEIIKYANSKRLYYWHISNLVIYDKPKELSEFNLYKPKKCASYRNGVCSASYRSDVVLCENLNCILKSKVERPPQSWCYVTEMR